MEFEKFEALKIPENYEAVGIGKVGYDRKEFPLLSHQHFITFRQKRADIFETVNLEFGIHYVDDSPELSFMGCVDTFQDFIIRNEIVTPEKMLKLIKQQNNQLRGEYWREYRLMELKFAIEQKDISTKFDISFLGILSEQNKYLKEENKNLREHYQELLQRKIDDVQYTSNLRMAS